jgi:hypothetical protein
MTTVGILTFLFTLTITPQAHADHGHDLTFLLTPTITPQVDKKERKIMTTVGIGLECYG